MNIFRALADGSHLLAMILLIIKIIKMKSCCGLSGKSQVFYLIVFFARYLDLFYLFISIYNFSLKVLFITLTSFTIFLIYYKFRKSYDKEDELPYAEFLLLPPFILALIINYEFSILEVLWAYSLYLESIAIVPQLFMVHKSGKVQLFTIYYLVFLAIYRLLYIVNWIWRYYTEGFYDIISIASGTVQTILYFDLFYLFCLRYTVPVMVEKEDDGKIEISNI